MNSDSLVAQFIPINLRSNFKVEDFKEKKKEWQLELVEKDSLIPKEIEGKDVVLNGFLDSVEIIDFPFQGKLMYLTFYRRRWKERGKNKSYFNTYCFHRPGMKTTDAFGDFLKGLTREEFDEFCTVWPGVRGFWKKDIRVVQKCLEWFHRTRGAKDTS